MKNDIELIGQVGTSITLKGLMDKVALSDQEQPLNIKIHSQGGSVYEGLAIYNYLKGLSQEVNTSSLGLVASIASIFFLAGRKETRQVSKNDSFLAHLPSSGANGNAVDLEKTAKELRKMEGQLADIYALETDLTKEEAVELMTKNEMSDIDFLLEKGFVNEINEFKAVAIFNKNDNKMITDEKMESMFEKFTNTIVGVFNKQKMTNKMVLDATGIEIDFPDVEDEGTPVAGDKATIDGNEAEGEYIMPNGDVFVFVGGALESITPKENEEGDQGGEALEEANAKIAELQAEIEAGKTATALKDEEIVALKAVEETVTQSLLDFKAEMKNEINLDSKKEGKKKLEAGTPNRTPLR